MVVITFYHITSDMVNLPTFVVVIVLDTPTLVGVVAVVIVEVVMVVVVVVVVVFVVVVVILSVSRHDFQSRLTDQWLRDTAFVTDKINSSSILGRIKPKTRRIVKHKCISTFNCIVLKLLLM